MNLLSLLGAVPTATRLWEAVRRAREGDPEALDYIKSQGWVDALNVVNPGAGETGLRVLQDLRAAGETIRRTLSGNVVDGEFREMGPWEPFVGRLFRVPFGGHIVLGSYGSGKTTLAVKLAQRYRMAFGYPVECVSMYGNDVPPWAVTISSDLLVRRMAKLKRYLESLAVDDESESEFYPLEGQVEAPPLFEMAQPMERPPSLPPTGRIIIIDEASLSMTSNPNDPARRSAIMALTQSRHLDWIVIYIGQWAGQLPLQLLGMTTVWVKKPDGREAFTDRDNSAVRDLWNRASESFYGLTNNRFYRPPFADPRAWAFCDCKSLGAHGAGFQGLIPFSPADYQLPELDNLATVVLDPNGEVVE